MFHLFCVLIGQKQHTAHCSSLIQTQIIWSFISEIFHSLEMKTKCFFFKVYLTESRGVRIWIPACLKTNRLGFDYVKPWIYLNYIFSWQCATIVIMSMEKLVNYLLDVAWEWGGWLNQPAPSRLPPKHCEKPKFFFGFSGSS